jgi:putative heme iron utilization protein
VSRALDADVARTVENVVRHLSRKHADTVLFLARRAAGISEAVDTQLQVVDRDGVDIAVRQPHGSTTARLDFPAPINAVSDLRPQLRGLLAKLVRPCPTSR